MSDIELFKSLGGDDDAIVTWSEFKSNLQGHPKLTVFARTHIKDDQDKIRSIFTRLCGNGKDVQIPYDKYKMMLENIESSPKFAYEKFI